MAARVHLSKADVTEVEEKYVLEALRSGWIAPLGPDVNAFEAEVAERVGAGSALALSSGTAALHLALLSVGVGPGTAVIVSDMTFAATANAVAYTGAEPVFVDCLEADGNVDPALLIEAVNSLKSSGTTISAAIIVDLFGACADYSRIEGYLAEQDIPLIEDAAEALGASRHGRPAGSFGTLAALSFNGNKIMTTSGGGMLLGDDGDLIAHARYLSTQARQDVAWYEHRDIGYNYRMSNILAALGRGQLSRLDEMIGRRRAIQQQYAEATADLPGVRLLGGAPKREGQEGNCWLTCMTIDPLVVDTDPASVIAELNKAEIEARHLWKPMHLQPVFADKECFGGEVSERLFREGLALPSGSQLSDDDITRVISCLRQAIQSEP